MVHERLQRHVIGKDGLRRLSANTAIRSGGVRCRRVQLGEQKTSLRATGVADNETGQGETVGDKVLVV